MYIIIQVISTLDFTKELMGQFTKLAQDDARDKKKMAKKEQLERAKEELSKVDLLFIIALIIFCPKLRFFHKNNLCLHCIRIYGKGVF